MGASAFKKCERVVADNPGFESITKIRDIIVGKKEVEIEDNFAQLSIYFKYASVTSVVVEKSFSN